MDTLAVDIRGLLGAGDRYWVEDASDGDQVIEYTRSGRLPIECLRRVRERQPRVLGINIDVSRGAIRVRVADEACEPQLASDSSPLRESDVKIGKIAGVDNPSGVRKCALALARCTATGVVPSFEAEISRDTLTLFACTAPQYCGLSLLEMEQPVVIDFNAKEIEAVVDMEQQSSKRQRRG